MNAEEISVTDWVTFYDKDDDSLRELQITEICAQKSFSRYIVLGYSAETNKTYINHAKILSPIPLTREMMSLNGFTENHYEMCTFWYKDMYVRVGAERHNVVGGRSFQIIYVHQLQRLLRLVGFDELAANFKIK